MKRNLLNIALAMAVMFLAQIAALAQQEPRGSVTHDLPSYKGAFSIDNDTGTTIRYSVRWGDKGTWKKQTLESGKRYTHSYPLDSNKEAPIPYVKFDRIGGDGSTITEQIKEMDFYMVRERGYGRNVGYGREAYYRRRNINMPKPYYFHYSANGREIHLYEK